MQKQSPPLGVESSIHLKVDAVSLGRHYSNFVSIKTFPIRIYVSELLNRTASIGIKVMWINSTMNNYRTKKFNICSYIVVSGRVYRSLARA